MAHKSFVGIDLHTDNFTVCFLKKDGSETYERFLFNDNGMADFKAILSKRDCIAVEAVANTSYFKDYISPHVKDFVVVAPSKFAVIAKSVKKTDKSDAYALALHLSKKILPKARVRSESSRRMLTIVETRCILVKTTTALRNKAYGLLIQKGIKIPKGTLRTNRGFEKHVFSREWQGLLKTEFETIYLQIQSLQKSIDKLETELVCYAESFPGYENIISIKGIGPLSAATIIAVIDDINDFKRPEQLSSYFGIVPIVRESNDIRRASRITKAGSFLGRRALAQCIYSAIRYNPELKKFYARIKKRRGTGKAIIASSRKLLVIIFYTLKNDWIHDDFPAHKYHVRNTAE